MRDGGKKEGRYKEGREYEGGEKLLEKNREHSKYCLCNNHVPNTSSIILILKYL